MPETLRWVRWESLTKRAFDGIDRGRAVVAVTCSPLEVHGPHLPLGADALEGEGLVERALRFVPERHHDRVFLKLPIIYAASDTVPQPGSLFFRPATTVRVLEDLGHTLARQGFHHVLVSNFHGGPRHFLAIEKASQKVNRRHGIGMVSLFSLLVSRLTRGTSNLDEELADVPGVVPGDLVGDVHGGLVETSQLLALHGDWVDPDYEQLPRQTVDTWLEARGERPADGRRGDPRHLLAILRSYRAGLRFFEECSYAGAPAGASADVGERILDRLAGHAARACTDLLDGTLDPEDCHSPVWKLRFLFLNPLMIRLSNRLMGVRNAIG